MSEGLSTVVSPTVDKYNSVDVSVCGWSGQPLPAVYISARMHLEP